MATQFNPETLTQIGRYTVVRFLAEGGMSWVFEVSDPEMYDRRVALKLIKPHVLAEGEMLKRYEDEVRLLARIEHPNLVRVYAQGTDAETGARFFTMDLIEGPNLGEVAAEWLIEPGQTTVGVTIASLAEIGDFFLGSLSALARVHAQGVFHRDIKPENIVVSHDGIAKLIDFGIARDTHKAGVTRAGLVPGTPQYMSPEQSLDETVGATSDLFSLGLTLYRVLTGRSIYAIELGDETKTQQVIRHLWKLYTDKGEFRFDFPDELPVAFHEVIRRACRIDPNARYKTALEMREALSRALNAPHQATGQTAAPAPRPAPRRASEPDEDERPPRRPPWLAIAASVASVGLLGGALAYFFWPPKIEGERAAVLLLERMRKRNLEVTRLLDWLKSRPEEAPRAIAAQAAGDLRRFSEDLDEAATDVKDRVDELALRQLDRVEQGFAAICDRFTNEYLEGSRASAEGAARDEYARVTDEARSLAAAEVTKLDAEFERLSAEIGTRGCDRAAGMRARIEAAAVVRELAEKVRETVGTALPKLVDEQILKAETAGAKAREPGVSNEHYLERLREGDAALERARQAQTAGEWKAAIQAAKEATESLERTALIGAAAKARAGADELVQQLDAIDAPLGTMRVTFEAAQRSFQEGEWQAAQSGFAALTPELRGRLAAAAPVIEVARQQVAECEPARRRGDDEDRSRLDESEMDARAKFRAAKFDEATALYGEIEEQCARIVAAADGRDKEAAEAAEAAGLKAGQLASQKSKAEAAKARAQKSLANLVAAKIGTARFAEEMETATALFRENRFEESESAYDKLDASLSALAKQSKNVVSLSDAVRTESRSAQNSNIPEADLSASNTLRDAGLARLAEGDLDGAREKLGDALAAYKKVRADFIKHQSAEAAEREKKLEEDRRVTQEAENAKAKLREVAIKPRGKVQGLISDLQARGLPLGGVAAVRDQAEAAFKGEKFDEAAAAFERASGLAEQQLEAGKPVLAARADAQTARDRALARGASGKPLADAKKRFDDATADLSGGKLQAALEGFRGSIASYDAAEADPQEVVKQLFSSWDRAWAGRDIALLRRTQSLSDAQEKGFAKVFDDNDSIKQDTRVGSISNAGANAYEVQLEYDRVLQAGASVKEQKNQKRVARVEKSGAGWVIASMTQK